MQWRKLTAKITRESQSDRKPKVHITKAKILKTLTKLISLLCSELSASFTKTVQHKDGTMGQLGYDRLALRSSGNYTTKLHLNLADC